MFDATLETRPLPGRAGRLTSVGAAASLHLLVAGLAIGGSYLILHLPPDPPTSHEIFVILPPPVQDSGGRTAVAAPRKPEAPAPGSATPALAPPREIPEEVPEAPVAPEPTLDDDPSAIPGVGEVGAGKGDGRGDGTGNGTSDGTGDGGEGGPPGPVWLAGEMTTPRLVSRVEPVYPEVMRRSRVGGSVVLQAVIGEDGRVESVETLRASNPLFAASAREAVLRWRYTPALQSGRPVRVYFTVRVEFEVR